MNLNDICDIRSGFSFRAGIENDPNGEIYAIQMRDLVENYSRILDFPHKVTLSKKEEQNHLLKDGDIIIIAKGVNNRALVFDKQYKAIASSAFFVIRRKGPNVDPYFLSWYLNSTFGQSYIKSNLKGTQQPNLLLQDLIQMPITLPPVKTQKILAKIYEVHKKELQLENELREQKNLFIEGLFNKIVKNESVANWTRYQSTSENQNENDYKTEWLGKEGKQIDKFFKSKVTKEYEEFLKKYGHVTMDEYSKELEKKEKEYSNEEQKIIDDWLESEGKSIMNKMFHLGEQAAIEKLRNKK